MSTTEEPRETAVEFGGVSPVLPVRDLAASIDCYVRRLGFTLDWEDGDTFASVSRGRCTLFLCEGGQGHPGTWVWIGVDDVEALLEEYRGTGARIRHPPTNYPWALEMQVEDLDGNVLRIGSDSREGEPTGEWLDMHGRRWIPQPGGGWKLADDSGGTASDHPDDS
ncbi:MAG TPA: glyoxalase superfamily protein [Longimicrobium sp.]|nr:glyoxalase superfamily protein [Longimicrobium sp.]